MLNSSTGEVEQIPEQQVQALYQAGTHQLSADPLHVVGQDGTVGTIDPTQAQAAFTNGARVAQPEEIHAAKLDAKYGGIGGSLAALGEGAARGLTLGASDPLAVGAAGLLGGPEAAAATREHLAGEKEANPLTSAAGELGGAALPVIFSGGAAGPEEAPGIAASLADGVRTLGAAPRAVSGLGDLAEHAVANVLGAGGSALSSAGRAAARTAVRGIVEGGLFAGGAEVSDATLENRPLTAEKLLSSVGHGALTAGLLGGALGGFGSLASEGAQAALGKLSPKLDDAANLQAAKWAGVEERSAARVGGAAAVGDTVLDEVIKPAVEEGGMAAAAMSPEEKLTRIRAATDRIGKQIGGLVEGSDATVPLEDLLKPIRERVETMRGRVGHESQVKALESLEDSVTRVLGGGIDEAVTRQRVERTPKEIADYLRSHPDILWEAQNGALPEHVRFKGFEEGAEKPAPRIPIADVIEQRRALQNVAYREAKSLDPNTRVQLLREVSGEWSNLEEKAINDASEDHAMGTQLRGLNRKFAQLKLAEDAAEGPQQVTRMNPLTMGFAAHSLLTGHPAVAAGMVGSQMARQALQQHGNAYAALMLDRLSTWGGIGKAVSEVNEQVDKSLDSMLAARRPVGRPASAKAPSNGAVESKYKEESQRIRAIAAVAPAMVSAHLQHATSSMQTHAPMLQRDLHSQTSRATQYLAGALPPQAPNAATSMTPHLDLKQDHSSPEQKIQFLRKVQAVEDGPGGIVKRMAQGRLTPEDVDVLRNVYPESLAEIQTKVQERCADRTKPVPYTARVQCGLLLGVPTDVSLTADFARAVQQGYAASSPKPQAPAGPSGRGKDAKLSLASASAGVVEAAMGQGDSNPA
jgi:hypothetical protein